MGSVDRQIDIETKNPDDKPSGTIRTDVDIPSQGIHKSVVEQVVPEYPALTENGNRRSKDPESGNGVSKISGIILIRVCGTNRP